MTSTLRHLTPMKLGETRAVEALPYLERYLASESSNDARLAASGIGKIAEVHPYACVALVPALFATAQSPHSQVAQYAVGALLKIPFSPDAPQRAILETLRTDHPALGCREAARIILTLPPEQRQAAWTSFRAAVADDDPKTTATPPLPVLATMSAVELGKTRSVAALPYLEKLLQSDTPRVVRDAVNAVKRIAESHPAECEALVPLLQRILSSPTKLARTETGVVDLLHRLNATVAPTAPTAVSTSAKPTLTLTGEQQKILTLSAKNPILIKGVAGSGKTTLAIMRARNLVCDDDLFRDTKIHVFSYTQSLVKFISGMFEDLPAESREAIGCGTVHGWCSDFLQEQGFWKNHKHPEEPLLTKALTEAIAEAKLAHPGRTLWNKPELFFREEIAWIKNQGLTAEADYLAAKRSGRGSADRVTADDKKAIRTVFENYERKRRERWMVDYEDYARAALAKIEAMPDFKPPFSHIVVDEAQDLSATQLRLIAKLISPETRSITLIADAAQRIYKSGFTWASVGIDVRGGGRSIELKHNYRNTVEIAQAALSLLAKDPDPADFTRPELPVRHGGKPRLLRLYDFAAHRESLPSIVSGLPHASESIVVLHRYKNRLAELASWLRAAGLPAEVIANKKTLSTHAGIHLCTMSSIKGLEFDHVILTDLNDHALPMKSGFTEPDDPLHIITERRLLYTCMTRAKKSLTLIASTPSSRYIAELDPTTLDQPKVVVDTSSL